MKKLIAEAGGDAESFGILGRIYKDRYALSRQQEDLDTAITYYKQGFEKQPLFGCRRGIAIVESKYRQELNPNVTMEWGWMRGMGKDVLYLVEGTFDLARADISGLLQDRFLWEAPEADISKAINQWLGC